MHSHVHKAYNFLYNVDGNVITNVSSSLLKFIFNLVKGIMGILEPRHYGLSFFFFACQQF